MDDYTREMMDLKTLVTRTLEKKGVLARIRAELRASVFEAIEEEDQVIEKEEGLPPALLGSCNDRAKQLHASPSVNLGRSNEGHYTWLRNLESKFQVEHISFQQSSLHVIAYTFYFLHAGRLLTALQKDVWKAELKEFSNKNGYDLNRNGDSPVLLDVLEGFLKFEEEDSRLWMRNENDRDISVGNLSQAKASGRRFTTSETETLPNMESWNMRRPSSSVAGGLPPLGRAVPSQSSDRRGGGSSMAGYRKDDYNWRYDSDELPEDVIRASSALENLQLDRKARNLTSSWRHAGDSNSEDDGRSDHM
ncbi:protein TONNEAU 1b-like [Senna tora]|uniref:Protein TONNEAU 1b-like n=1 Tax=Senna tora TaxID=362788 RepID=A0A834WK63_9FABA|nr:protein TONNEAU 1b-like [Senna tora]